MAANLSPNALLLLKQRYLLKDSKGRVKETPEHMFRRVSKAVASAELRYSGDAKKAEGDFHRVMKPHVPQNEIPVNPSSERTVKSP